MDLACQSKSVHGTGHIHIRKDNTDALELSQQNQGFVRVTRFDDRKPKGRNLAAQGAANVQVILDQQDQFPRRRLGHLGGGGYLRGQVR